MKPIRWIALAALTLVPLAAQYGRGPRGPQQNPPAPVVQPVSAEEAATLIHMREEEKLARDVYRFLYEKWNYAAFQRIANAEQEHFASVGVLLTRYGITDPAANDVPSVYQDPKLASMYAELTNKGSLSLRDALEVGVAIEKADIADLTAAIGATDKFDMKRVYTNLLEGSLRHQEAFEYGLELLDAVS